MRQLSAMFFAIAVLGSAAASAQGWNPEFRGKLEEEARANDARAAALNPIIARNTQARNDMLVDVQQLTAEARGMHDRARWFRAGGNRMMGRFREHLIRQADELDRNAMRNEQLAAGQQNLANQLQTTIQSLSELRAWHIETANRLRESLAWR